MSESTGLQTEPSSPPPSARDVKSWRLFFNNQAMARLAQGTSVVVASLLAVPDAFALVPSSPTLLNWALRVLRVWLVALILWFIGFWGILHVVRMLSGGIEVTAQGLKLWRLGKLTPWEQIIALGSESQKAFSAAFCLKPVARRLTVYTQKKSGRGLNPLFVPSFLYGPEEFDSLVNSISKARFGFEPDSPSALVCSAQDLPAVAKMARQLKVQRALLSVVIALGLVMFLGRRAAVNYWYATGNQVFKKGSYATARDYYQQVTNLDPAFAVAWHNLAGAEFRLGQFDKAREHWQRALFLKRDFVEAKVSLAYLCTQQRDFAKSRELLESALRLDPRNTTALINLADLDMRLGHTRQAMKTAQLVLTQAPDNHLAACLIAQGRLRMGKGTEALAAISDPKKPSQSRYKETFCRLVAGEIQLSLGHRLEAIALFQSVLKDAPRNADATLYLGRARLEQGRLQEADDLLYKASKLAPANPWPILARADLQRSLHDPSFAEKLFNSACSLPNQDARSLSALADLALKLGHRDKAIALAQKALKIERVTPEALIVLEKANKEPR